MRILHTNYDAGSGGIQEMIALYLQWSSLKFKSNYPWEMEVFSRDGGMMNAEFEKAGATVRIGRNEGCTEPDEFTGYNLVVASDVNGTYPKWVDKTARHTPIINFHHCVYASPVPSSKFVETVTTSANNNRLFGTSYLTLDAPTLVPELPNKLELRERFDIREGEIVIGRFGRYDRTKRIEDFIRVAASMKDSGFLFVVGGGPDYFGSPSYKLELEALAKSLGARVNFYGEMSPKQRSEFIGMMDCFLYPTSDEGYCLAFLEAMARKIPVVTYDNFANKETTGGFAYLTNTGNIEGLKQGVEKALSEDNQLRLHEAQRLVSIRNSPEVFARKLDALIEKYADSSKR